MFMHPKAAFHKSIILSMAFSLLGVTLALAASGDLDPTFSGDGWVATDFNWGNNKANDILIQPDGKIVAAGSSYTAMRANTNFDLVRYTPEGRLDRTFGSNGRVQTNFGGDDTAFGMALQANGKIVLAGETCQSGYCNVALARYTADGTLDPTFSGDGKVVRRSGTASNLATDVALQADGKIVVGGYVFKWDPYVSNIVVYRYLRNGSLDPTFSGDGIIRLPIREATASALAIQPGDGKIVVVGRAFDELTSEDIVVVRLTPDGALDPTFSGDGIQRTHISSGSIPSFDQAFAVAIQPDGKIVVAGETISDSQFASSDAVVVRYNANGTLDTTFSRDGILILDIAGSFHFEEATGVVVLPDGKLVLAYNSTATNIVLVRLQPNGAFDRSFHGDEHVAVGFEFPKVLARQSFDGKYVIGGWIEDRGWDFLIARVLP